MTGLEFRVNSLYNTPRYNEVRQKAALLSLAGLTVGRIVSSQSVLISMPCVLNLYTEISI